MLCIRNRDSLNSYIKTLSYHRNLMSLSNVSLQCPISSPLTLPLDSCCRTIACFFCSNVWKYISTICIIRSLHCSFYRKLSVCSFQGTYLTELYQSLANSINSNSLITGKNQLYGTALPCWSGLTHRRHRCLFHLNKLRIHPFRCVRSI